MEFCKCLHAIQTWIYAVIYIQTHKTHEVDVECILACDVNI